MWSVGVLWLVLCAAGSYGAMRSDFQPGRLGPALAQWPADSAFSRPPHQAVVVAFLHPRCDCSRATVTQLLDTLAAFPATPLLVSVLIPADSADRLAWEQTEHVRRIQAARPDARILFDRDGAEATRFGAMTSGTIVVYDPRGQERFRGGITNRRGGYDDNPGRRALHHALASFESPAQTADAPVFGCPISAQGGV